MREKQEEKQKSLLRLEVAALIKLLSPEDGTTPPLALTLFSSLAGLHFFLLYYLILPSLPGTLFIIATICFPPNYLTVWAQLHRSGQEVRVEIKSE